MAKNKAFYAPSQSTAPAPTEENEVLKGIEDDVFEEAQVEPEAPVVDHPSYPSYVLDGTLAHSDAKLPHEAFKAAAAKYFPEQCVIIAYAITDAGTIVVLDAGLQGRRKEIIGA